MKKWLLLLLISVVTTSANSLDIGSWLRSTSLKIRITSTLGMIKHFETYQGKPYKLGAHWYVGYGHLTEDSIREVTQRGALLYLRKDFSKDLSYLPQNISVQRRYLLALLSYNIGIGKVLRSRIYRQRLRLTNRQFCELYVRYCYFEGHRHIGLYNRRKTEIEIWYGSILDK